MNEHDKDAALRTERRRELRRAHQAAGLQFQWSLTNHVCRACFGRVLAREAVDGRVLYRCSNCGVEREGASEAAICSCGIKLRTGRDAGIRCRVNEAQSPEWPNEVVAEQIQPAT